MIELSINATRKTLTINSNYLTALSVDTLQLTGDTEDAKGKKVLVVLDDGTIISQTEEIAGDTVQLDTQTEQALNAVKNLPSDLPVAVSVFIADEKQTLAVGRVGMLKNFGAVAESYPSIPIPNYPTGDELNAWLKLAQDQADKAQAGATAATTAAGNAETARGEAEAAKTAAVTAQAAATQAATDATTAQAAAEAAKTAATTAQGKAEEAQGKAETAQGKAEEAQGKAETAQGKAAGSATAAASSATQAAVSAQAAAYAAALAAKIDELTVLDLTPYGNTAVTLSDTQHKQQCFPTIVKGNRKLTIGASAFECSNIEEIVAPEGGIKSIGTNAFRYSKLKAIKCTEAGKFAWKAPAGMLSNGTFGSPQIGYLEDVSGVDFSEVTSVNEDAFYGCSKLWNMKEIHFDALEGPLLAGIWEPGRKPDDSHFHLYVGGGITKLVKGDPNHGILGAWWEHNNFHMHLASNAAQFAAMEFSGADWIQKWGGGITYYDLDGVTKEEAAANIAIWPWKTGNKYKYRFAGDRTGYWTYANATAEPVWHDEIIESEQTQGAE